MDKTIVKFKGFTIIFKISILQTLFITQLKTIDK